MEKTSNIITLTLIIVLLLVTVFSLKLNTCNESDNVNKKKGNISGWENDQLIVYPGSSLGPFFVPTTPKALFFKNTSKWNIHLCEPYNKNTFYILQSLARELPDTIWARKKGFIKFNPDETAFLIWTDKNVKAKILITAE